MPLWEDVEPDEDETEEKLPDGKLVKRFCLECGAQMVIRTNRHDDSQFLGCSRYPDCRRTDEIPESLRMELDDQPKLL